MEIVTRLFGVNSERVIETAKTVSGPVIASRCFTDENKGEWKALDDKSHGLIRTPHFSIAWNRTNAGINATYFRRSDPETIKRRLIDAIMDLQYVTVVGEDGWFHSGVVLAFGGAEADPDFSVRLVDFEGLDAEVKVYDVC